MHKWLFLLLANGSLAAQIMVETVAGGKVRSGVPAQQVALTLVSGTTWDREGNLVFTQGHIRRIRPDGVIETIAGMDKAGFSGDGGPALAAKLAGPGIIRSDSRGNLYFVDQGNHRIRRISPDGTITSIAGDGIFWREGMDVEGPALERSLGTVNGLAVDAAGNVYVADQRDMVRRVTPSGRIEIFARIPFPRLLELVGSDLYVVQMEQQLSPGRIQRISPDGTITPFAGFGSRRFVWADEDGKPAIELYFETGVYGLSADAAGNIHILQPQSNLRDAPATERIRRIDRSGIITTLMTAQSISWIAAGRGGNVAFFEGSMLREIAAGSTPRTLAGSSPQAAPDGTPAREAWLLGVRGMGFDRAGELLFLEGCSVRQITSSGLLATVAGSSVCGTEFPFGIFGFAVDRSGRAHMVDQSGRVYRATVDKTFETLPLPRIGNRIAIDAQDRIHLMSNSRLVRISQDGTSEELVRDDPLFGPRSLGDIGVDAAGKVHFVANPPGDSSLSVYRVNEDGSVEPIYSGIPNGRVTSAPLAVDAAGKAWLGGLVVVSATGAAPIGWESRYSGEGGLMQSSRLPASGVAISPAGQVYLASSDRIDRLTGSGPTGAPSIAPGGIVNALSYTAGPIAPGELVAIFGLNFGSPGLQMSTVENGGLPRQLNRTKVLFNGIPGAIVSLTPEQINVFVPNSVIPGQPAQVAVLVDDVLSARVIVPVAQSAFGLATADQSGSGSGAILNQDGTVNSPQNPATRGSVVSLFGTGEGKVYPEVFDGDLSISTPYSAPVQPVAVSIGALPAQVLYAAAAPLLPIGVMQINVRIPMEVPPGNVAVSVSIGSASAAKQVTVAVQ